MSEFVLERTLRAHYALTVQVFIIRTIQVLQPVGQFTPKTQKSTLHSPCTQNEHAIMLRSLYKLIKIHSLRSAEAS